MTATLCLKEEGGSSTRLCYSSEYANIRFGRIAFPIIDAKLVAFTENLMGAATRLVLKREWKQQFADSYDPIMTDLFADPSLSDALRFKDMSEHMPRMLEYNVKGGKAYRALLVRLAMQTVAKRELTEEEVEVAHVLGWCVETLQAMALVADDIMDGSVTRRGKPCWYKDVGTACAINDSLLLYSAAYELLAAHFGGEVYSKFVRLLGETCMKTCVGQALDSFSEQVQDLEEATEERYAAIVLYKTSFYTFYAPMAFAIVACRLPEEESLLQEADSLSRSMGQLFQEQDDYMDCFGDPEVTGKVGTDIQDSKCSWLLVYALKQASASQREELGKMVGTRDGVPRVKQIYEELGVHQEYARRQSVGVSECTKCSDRLKGLVLAIVPELVDRKA